MLLTVICIILLVVAAALTYRSTTYGTAVAFLGLCTAGMVPGVTLATGTYLFWGTAMLIVIALNFILPPVVTKSRIGVPYIFVGTMAGMLVGLVMSHAAMIIGAVAGAVLAGVAYARTPGGHQLAYPSRRFWNYLCAKALPAIIAFCIIGTTLSVINVEF